MKKLLLFIGLSVISFGAFAEKVPTVVVNKSQGGFTALFNLYNYVQYTPAELTATGVAQLDCMGSGFAPCRVPNCNSLNINNGNTVTTITETSKLNAFMTAINDVINQYELALEQSANADVKTDASKGVSVPSAYTKTVAMASNTGGPNGKKAETFVVRGVVTASNSNSSTMKIYIEKVNLYPTFGSN
jgi:hypothetical protein